MRKKEEEAKKPAKRLKYFCAGQLHVMTTLSGLAREFALTEGKASKENLAI